MMRTLGLAEKTSQTQFSFLGELSLLNGQIASEKSDEKSVALEDVKRCERKESPNTSSCSRCNELTQECLALTVKL